MSNGEPKEFSGQEKISPELEVVKLRHFGYSEPKSLAEENCDELLAVNDQIIGVLDGVGRYGARAAHYAKEALEGKIPTLFERGTTVASVEQVIAAILRQVNVDIHERERDKKREASATTVSLVGVVAEPGKGMTAVAANVGDSRIYSFHPTTGLKRHTNLVREKNAAISSIYFHIPELAEDQRTQLAERFVELLDSIDFDHWQDIEKYLSDVAEAQAFRIFFEARNNVHTILGMEDTYFRPEVVQFPVEHGTLLLALTDGIFDTLPRDFIADVCQHFTNDPEGCARHLMKSAKSYAHSSSVRAKPDDRTACVAIIE